MDPTVNGGSDAATGIGTRIRDLGVQTSIYGFGRALRRGIGFLLIPIYTRFLTPVDYGYLELLSVTAMIASTLGTQGMTTAFFRFYPFADDDRDRSRLLSTCYLYMLMSGIVLGCTLYAGAGPVSRFLFGSIEGGPLFVRMVALYLCFQSVVLIPNQLFRARLQPVRFIVVTLIGFLVQLLLNVYLVAFLQIGVLGVLIGQAAGSGLLVVITFFMIRKDLVPVISMDKLKVLLPFGLPLIVVGIARWVLEISDRVLLQKLATTQELGLYSLGAKFANILVFGIIAPFSTAWGAYCFRIATEPNAKETYGRIATYFLLVLCTAGMGLVIWMPPVIKIVAGEDFWGAAQVVLPLVCANVIAGMVQVFDLGVNLARKTKYMSYIVGFGAIVNVGLNLALIPRFGMVGAAVGSLLAFACIAVMTYRTSQSLYRIPFEKGRFLKIALVFAVVALAGALYEAANPAIDVAVRAILTAAFFVALLLLRLLRKDEMDYLKTRLRRGRTGS